MRYLGPLRALAPSPIQSNWRVQLEPRDDVGPTIFFLKTSLSSLPATLAARLFADGLPAQWASVAKHTKTPKSIELSLGGSWQNVPNLHARILTEGTRDLPPSFENYFDNYDQALAYLTNQSGALSILDGAILYSQIDIPIAAADVRPAQLECAAGELLNPLTNGAECFAFIVPSVPFQAMGERSLRSKATHARADS